MADDPARVDESRAWFVKARDDLVAARLLLSADPPLCAAAAFHAQQAAEKAMKGFLAWHDRPFRKTHNLVEIGQACSAIDQTMGPLLRRAAVLTEYAWKFRYPGQAEGPPVQETQAAVTLAEEVHEVILAKVPQQVRP